MRTAASTVCDPYCIETTRPTSDKRQATIREAAYYRAQRRGFAPGHELEDWLLAEREIEAAEVAAGKGR